MARIYASGVLVALAAGWGAVTYSGAAGLAAVVAAERAGFALALLAMIRPLSRRPSGGTTTWMAWRGRPASIGTASDAAALVDVPRVRGRE